MESTAKRLIVVNGPMGVGKTAVCRQLVRLCAPAAFLDGDWCWMLEPFTVTPHTKELVLSNIAHMLESYGRCPACRTVVFCWVMQAPREGRAQQGLCRAHMRGSVRRLCAVAQRLYAAQRAEHAHPGGRKGLGAGRRIGRGQAQHHVRPARKRRFGAHLRGHQRVAAALHHTGAHHTHHGVKPQRAYPAYLVRMPVVERVIFGNNARSAHSARLPSACRAAKMAARPVFGPVGP